MRPPRCASCVLAKTGTGFTQPEGTGASGLLVVGEASGREEAATGLPFRPYAPSGSLLQRAIRRHGITRDALVITNILRCQPPGNVLEGAAYERAAIEHCLLHLYEVAEAYRPRAVLALGGVALRTLTGEPYKIAQARGFVLDSILDIPLVASYHPAYLRRGGGDAGASGMHLLGVFYRDFGLALKLAAGWRPPAVPEKYTLEPSVDEARAFARRVLGDPEVIVAYDIETCESSDESDLIKAAGPITQIQFSTAPGHAIVFPWYGEYVDIARDILVGPNVKAGHNAWKFDNRILAANGIHVRGLVHDTMEMWRRYEPDLPVGLQFVASMIGFPRPWKHLSGAYLRYYGCCDVDATYRALMYLIPAMKRIGCWRSYERHVLCLEPVLARMSARGIPVDPGTHSALVEEIAGEVQETNRRIQELVPASLRPVHPEGGYENVPKDAREGAPTTHAGEAAVWDTIERDGVRRWVKRLQFNAASPRQLFRYMEHHGYPIPLDPKTGKPSTGKLGLRQLYHKTGDEVLRLVIESRELEKLASTYLAGWSPEGGRVHSTFGHGTGSGQLTSRSPNVQNMPARGRDSSSRYVSLARRFRSMVQAQPGHMLVELDLKSAHALTLGFEARDPDYMRIARIDMHSFVAVSGILRLEKPDALIALPDEELAARLRWYRKNWKAKDGTPFDHTRNTKAKPAILGYGFAMGARTLYRNNQDAFRDEAEARKVIEALDALFPRQPRYRWEVRKRAAAQGYLISRHGYIRWFHDVGYTDPATGRWVNGEDAEACVAFLPANDAHGYLKDKMLLLDGWTEGNDVQWWVTRAPTPADSWLERAGLINQIHDALLFEVPDGLVEEAIHRIKSVLETPDPILRDPVVAPDGLRIECDVKVGRNWGEMEG